jgi:transcriptional regulator with XRE-family HTH domain
MPSAIRIEMGSRMRECRLAVRLSQDDAIEAVNELAASSGRPALTSKALSSWETGDRMPSLETLGDLCLVYGVSADFILRGSDTIPREMRELFQRIGSARPTGKATTGAAPGLSP